MEDEKKLLSTEETEENITEDQAPKSLDALLLDAEDDSEDDDSGIDFEAFMADYRSLITKNLSEAKEARNAKAEKIDEEIDEEDEEKFLISLPKKTIADKKTKKRNENGEEWDEEITLEPEKYADLPAEGEEMYEELPEEVVVPNFDLGEKKEEKKDTFQISISFDGEKSEEVEEEEDEEPVSKYDPETPRAIDWVFDIAEMFVFVLVIVVLLTSFIFKHSVVEGSSMNNTLQHGDHLIISDLFYTPERGDIIVFEDYSTSLRKAVVKRVIAIPGDKVEVLLDDFGNVRVKVNGHLIPEDYALNTRDVDIDTSNFNKTIVVKEGEVVESGTHEELLERDGLYAKLITMQHLEK